MSTMRQVLVSGVVLLTLCGATAGARPAQVAPRDQEPAEYVTVPLDGVANDALGADLPAQRVTVDGIPFDLVQKPDADNLFLKDAGWADWAKDPSSYYSDYDRNPLGNDPNRVILNVPVADYTAAYLLAATENSEEFSPVVSLRIGAMGGGWSDMIRYHDFCVEVPRMGQDEGGLGTVPVEGGNLFLVRLPLGKAIAQDFKAGKSLNVDVTKELRLAIRRPDPCRFRIRPLGLPSGVHIFGLTFQKAPVQMEVESLEPGHVFNEPQTPTFRLALRRLAGAAPRCSVRTVATHYYGEAYTHTVDPVELREEGDTVLTLPVEVPKRGYYDLAIEVLQDGRTVLTRETTFALLAPDTRQHRDSAPFGTWDFSGGHFTPKDPELLGPLYVKAGLRYGMFGQPEEVRKRYGVIRGNDPKPGPEAIAEMGQRLKDNPAAAVPERIMIFHETAISGPHITRVPSLFSGRDYTFNEREQATFQGLWDQAMATAKAVREHLPDAEIYFGNGNPQLLEEFLKRGFPKELLGSRGNEAGNYQRMPEAQPPDWISNGAGLWMDRELLDHYGYTDTPLRQCYEMCYPNTNPGNLSYRTQANYLVRHMMHSLAWEIPIIRAYLITDVGNSYYFSNWGASGLCHARPHVRPKPSYVALAVMTQVLDGARFTRVVPAGSPVLYAVEFRRPDGQYVTCLWTVRGVWPVLVSLDGPAEVLLTDMMGNESRPALTAAGLRLSVSDEPLFLTSAGPVERITPGRPRHEGRPEGERFLVSSLGSLDEWTVEQERSLELETYSFMCPRRKGEFEYAVVESFEGEQNALQVRPNLPVPGPVYLPMYSVLRHDAGVQIPGQPTEIGLMVNGNGGWGRIIFELEDAAGQRWASVGAEQAGEPTAWLADVLSAEEFARLEGSGLNDWNTDDPWGRSYINFEGWRYLKFPLPGNYPGEGYHWPYSSQWRYSDDGVVHYPLTFKKLIIALPEKALHIKDYAPAPRQEIYLKDLMVTYEPPEKAFVAP